MCYDRLFKLRLGISWADQKVVFDWTADITRTGDSTDMVENDSSFLLSFFIGIFRLIYLYTNGIPVPAPFLTQPVPTCFLKQRHLPDVPIGTSFQLVYHSRLP